MSSPAGFTTVPESAHLILAVQHFCRKSKHCSYLKVLVWVGWFRFLLSYSPNETKTDPCSCSAAVHADGGSSANTFSLLIAFTDLHTPWNEGSGLKKNSSQVVY